ncbi:MAG: hypothetical protein HUK24_05645 [Sphaerochaetaceae bacterium]|nr:hypothetical protein [Sphaerochaetaceae bacterium]
MKKLVLIALVSLVLFTAFAEPVTRTLTTRLSGDVSPIEPIFYISGGLEQSSRELSDEFDGNIDSAMDISREDITIYFHVYQGNESKYVNGSGVDITITTSPFKLDGNAATSGEGIVKLESAGEGTNPEGGVISWNGPNGPANNTVAEVLSSPVYREGLAVGVKYTIKYSSGYRVPANTEIGKFQVTWASNKALIEGAYSADVTMTYEVQ